MRDLLNLSEKIWQGWVIYGSGEGTLRNRRLQHFIWIGKTIVFHPSRSSRAVLKHLVSLHHSYQLGKKQDLIGRSHVAFRGGRENKMEEEEKNRRLGRKDMVNISESPLKKN